MDFCFDDAAPAGYNNRNGGDDQIYVLGNDSQPDCGTILVKETGYYDLYDSELSESCEDQKDETGYLTVHNSCNKDGWATTRNVGERYLVADQDNEGGGCTSDNDCSFKSTPHVCREGNSHGRCCVPKDPVFMGTYLLVEGEENVICIHHWCPEWKSLSSSDPQYDDVFVHDKNDKSKNCSSADSIHFKIAATALACKRRDYLQPCAGGCNNGDCIAHPCIEANCPKNCRLGGDGKAQCIDYNPCDNISCEHGCAFGLCLQGPTANGPDFDKDGYPNIADCNDLDASVNPGATEIPGNGVDDDCDGYIDDEQPGNGAGGGTGTPDAGFFGGAPGVGGANGSGGNPGADDGEASGDDSGCGCRAAGGTESTALGVLLALAAAAGVRRRRTR